MTDTPTETKKDEKKGFEIPWGAVIGAIPTLIGALVGAGWPGLIALVVGGVGLFFGYNYLIKVINAKIDNKDLANAGADAGTTANDLANQAQDVNSGLNNMQNANPPKPPVQ